MENTLYIKIHNKYLYNWNSLFLNNNTTRTLLIQNNNNPSEQWHKNGIKIQFIVLFLQMTKFTFVIITISEMLASSSSSNSNQMSRWIDKINSDKRAKSRKKLVTSPIFSKTHKTANKYTLKKLIVNK